MRNAVLAAAAIWLSCASLSGCSDGGLKTHSVRGKVELKGGDVGILQGGHVEFMQDSDPSIRPSGKIVADGSFSVETLYQGEVLSGAPEGNYKVRIILGDESDEGVPKRKGNPVHRRFLEFATSGLTLTVPASDYNVSVSSK